MERLLSSKEIRKLFLDYFEEKGHKIVSSYPLVPPNDPTLMFTNAGMVQFKDLFLGKEKRPYSKAASIQKCIRISGKHNDLENVGFTSRHHTFFEMLGNFSFGDYFKEEAIWFGWDLLVNHYKLDPDRIWITVHKDDEEAYSIWKDKIGIKAEKIFKMGDKDNFWAMGDTGPCGPCSELLYDRGEKFGAPIPENGERFFELWNLVFMQYQVDEPNGPRKPLPNPCIDTGMGLERLTSILQQVDSNFETDLFLPLIREVERLSGYKYGEDSEVDVSLRVVADHSRMTAFLIAEGIFPDKTGREYVLRRVMRRAIRHGHKIGIKELFFHKVVLKVVEIMGDLYPELVERKELIDKVTQQEEALFRRTLERGLNKINSNTVWIERDGFRYIPGELAYDLYQQDGFPRDLIEVIGKERGFLIDEEGWLKEEERHKLRSGKGKIGEEEIPQVYHKIKSRLGRETIFTGYEKVKDETYILALIDPKLKVEVEAVEEGMEVEVVVEKTPFYGEAGGQVGDTGIIRTDDSIVEINDTQRVLDLFIHKGVLKKGRIKCGDKVTLEVDVKRRESIKRNHTATHLLHWALRRVLGPHATQKGSLLTPQYLRFDFAHSQLLSQEEIKKIEELVNERVIANLEVNVELLPLEEARRRGATMIFEEKYKDLVRLVEIKDTSKELCGGTHVTRTGEIGLVKITKQESVATGVRRIYAVTGMEALNYIYSLEELVLEASTLLKEEKRTALPQRIQKLLEENKELKAKVETLKHKLIRGVNDWTKDIQNINGIKVVAISLEEADSETVLEMCDNVREKLKSGIALVGGKTKDGKGILAVLVTKDLTHRFKAPQIIKELTPILGGKGGGGRDDLARGGGPLGDKIDEVVNLFYNKVREMVIR